MDGAEVAQLVSWPDNCGVPLKEVAVHKLSFD